MQKRHDVVCTKMVSRNRNKRNRYIDTQRTRTGHLVLSVGRDTSFFGSIIVHSQSDILQNIQTAVGRGSVSFR